MRLGWRDPSVSGNKIAVESDLLPVAEVAMLPDTFFIVVGARYQRQPVSRCVYIWVDKDFAMYRGWIQGFPKKLGSIHMTRLFAAGQASGQLASYRIDPTSGKLQPLTVYAVGKGPAWVLAIQMPNE